MSKQAHYHQPGQEPVLLRVVKQSKGTVDLAKLDSDEIVVSQCPLEAEPKPGSATLVKTAAKAPKASSENEQEQPEKPDEEQEAEPQEESSEQAGE